MALYVAMSNATTNFAWFLLRLNPCTKFDTNCRIWIIRNGRVIDVIKIVKKFIKLGHLQRPIIVINVKKLDK